MKYLPNHSIFFLHIPKCGGMSLHKALDLKDADYTLLASDLGISESDAALYALSERYGPDTRGLTRNGFDHATLGRVHPVHLTTKHIHDFLPATWQALENSAHSFALLRNPRDRFISALMQRMKEFGDAGAIRADDKSVVAEAKHVCDWLGARTEFSDIEYVHFTRQSDYVELDGRQVVKMILPLKNTNALVTWLREATGLEIEIPHTHARRQPKKWAKSVQPVARGLARTLLPRPLKKALHPLWMNSGIFSDSAKAYGATDLGPEVETFIKSYYARDAVLLAKAQENAATFAQQAEAN